MITFDPNHHSAQNLLLNWINRAPGAFCTRDMGIGKMDYADKNQLFELLETLVRVGHLEHYGKNRGWYIKTQSELVEQDYINADSEPIDIWLPFGLSDLVKLHSGSVIVIAGNPNVGKSALILNMIKENRLKEWDQYLFNSESDAGELKERLEAFPDISLDVWGFKAYSRYEDFHQVVKPGKNVINYIDFLELHKDFWAVGGMLKQIHNKLNGAIAVVALQKNPGQEAGLGGNRTLEVTRLAISLDFQKAKCVKAKSTRKIPENPEFNINGRFKKFKLFDGYKIISPDGWYNEKPVE